MQKYPALNRLHVSDLATNISKERFFDFNYRHLLTPEPYN